MTGPEFKTFATEINGGASIGDTVLFQFINISRAMVEQLDGRPWMILRNTDTSITVSASSSSAWNTAISLASIARFNRFYGDHPIKLFDGNNRIEYYREVPFKDRLQYKDIPNTFCFDEANQNLYLNGTIAFSGTLYIDHIKDSPEITNTDASSWIFPSWSHSLLGYMAVAMNKGGVDFDDVNRAMAPENQARANEILRALKNWDNSKQLAAVETTDPTLSHEDGYRSGAINMN